MFLQFVEKSVLNGITTAGVGAYLWGTKASINVLGIPIPLAGLTFLGGFMGNIVGDVLHDNITHNLPIDRKIESKMSIAVSGLANGFTFYTLLQLVNSEVAKDYGLKNSLITGILGELSSSGICYLIKNKM